MQQRDAIRRVLARVDGYDSEMQTAVESAPSRGAIGALADLALLSDKRDAARARIYPLLAALAKAVVEAPPCGFTRNHILRDGIERTPAIDAALDALAKEADRGS